MAACGSQHLRVTCWMVAFPAAAAPPVGAAHHIWVEVLDQVDLAPRTAGGLTPANTVERCSRTVATWRCIGAVTQVKGPTSVGCATMPAPRAPSSRATWRHMASLVRRSTAVTFAKCPSACTALWKNTWKSGMENIWWPMRSKLSKQREPKTGSLFP